ncbi:MAG: allantoinase AllB [Synergistaceae bacterium]|jgi:allantoinase|nr:allantoinase AllB [Synergistaceae bacterium]
MTFDLVIKNGSLVTAETCTESDLGLKDGKIAGIVARGTALEGKEIIDASGLIVVPGLVDVHAHGGHGDPDRESFGCMSEACAAGGITTFIDMPLSNPSTLTPEELKKKIATSGRESVTDYALYGGLVGGYLNQIEPMSEAGARAFKCFTCRCSNYPMTDDGTLVEGMKVISRTGGLISVHAENDTLIQVLVDKFKAEGRNDAQAFLDSHPVYSELEAVRRVFYLAGVFPDCRVHIAHMSTAEGAELLAELRGKGAANISAETCPQYLGLTEEDLLTLGPVAKFDPPARPRENMERMWKYVLDGTIDCISSDHSPHPPAKKTVVDGNFWPVSEGCSGVQTLLPVTLTEGRKRGLTWERFVQVCSTRPAEMFGLGGSKGKIAPGFDADLTLIDPDAVWTLKDEDLFYLNKRSPFSGRQFKGKVIRTLVRGVTVFHEGKICAPRGFGQYVPMQKIGR